VKRKNRLSWGQFFEKRQVQGFFLSTENPVREYIDTGLMERRMTMR